MTTRARFNAEDWATITQAPLLAAAAVAGADRGGRFGESMALARAYAAEREARHTELVAQVVSTPPGVDTQGIRSADDLAARALERGRAAMAILARQAEPAEVDDYRAFVLQLAEGVARAHKEGGVLGIGGEEIGAGERGMLERLREALQVAPPA